MGIKCPKCKSINTERNNFEMICNNCAHSWKPYKHRGKKMKRIGDGIVFPKKRIMPGAKTKTIGDGILFPKKRIKKTKKKKRDIWSFP